MTRLVIIGFAAQDFVFQLDELPTRGVKYRAHAFDAVGGGLAANASVAAVRLGAEVSFITRLGQDGIGRDILDTLAREGIDCTLSRQFRECRSPLSAIAVDAQGERMLINYADPSFPVDTGWLPSHLPADVAGVMGETRWEEGALHLFRLARQRGIPAVLDGDRRIHNPDLAAAASHVAYSAQAVRETAGCDDLADAFAVVARGAGNIVAVTDGPRGVWYVDQGRMHHQPAFPVNAVDTLGAGDTFHGALTVGLAEGMPLAVAMRFAAAAAAIKCTRFGGRNGAPTRAEVEALLAGA